MPTVRGLLVSVEMRHRATVYSFQALIKIKISVVTMPGAATGRSTRVMDCSRLHPSMVAACSISAEMPMKVPRRSQMVKAWLKAALMKIRPSRLSVRPRRSIT